MVMPQSLVQPERFQETRVSGKGQTVIPRAIRRLLGIEAGTRLRWELRGQVVMVYPVVEDPVAASQGRLQGLGVSLPDFLEQRHGEEAKEVS